MNPEGTSISIPRKSLICVEKIVSAIPLVNPTTIGYGMNLKMAPIRHSPITTSITPAMIVAIIRPCIPYSATTPATITMNAPVGPPIRNLDPPNTDTRNPAMTAVMSPCCGVTPLAIPNAMASGRAIMPTMIPAARSDANVLVL